MSTFFLCVYQFMRLAYLLGNGSDIERSPVNRQVFQFLAMSFLKVRFLNSKKVKSDFFFLLQWVFQFLAMSFLKVKFLNSKKSKVISFFFCSAALSMLPWPKPAIWPSVPSDASSEVLAKEKVSIFIIIFYTHDSNFNHL